jgi:hypothetical protein
MEHVLSGQNSRKAHVLRRRLVPCAAAFALLLSGAAFAQGTAPNSADSSAAPRDTNPTVTATPPDFPRGKISGYLFGDVYYNVTGDPTHLYSISGADSAAKVNIDGSGVPITRDLNGVQIRRIYFQLDNDLSIRFSTRLRLEADSRALTSDGKIGVLVKNAYLQARQVYPRGDVFAGMINTPTWETSEELWGYRSIEKTIADFRGLASSSDLGVEVKGFVDPDHRVGYSAMVGDGTGQRPEDNRYKRVYAALPVHVGALWVEPYADYENAARSSDRATYKLTVGYEPPHSVVGLEIVDRVQHRLAGNTEPAGASVFARWSRDPRFGAFARFDFWKPDRRASNRVDQLLWIAGVDWQPFKDVHLMPNLEAMQYDAKGTAAAPSHNELQARVTIYYRFSKPQS